MKLLRGIITLAFVLSSSVAIAQTGQGSSPLTIAKGGTNATTASQARTNLGLAIGTNVQAWDADLDALAGLTYAADKCTYFTGTHTAATFDCLSWSRAVISAANAGAGRTAFGLAIGADVQAYDADLAAIAGLTSANNKCFYWTGSGTAANYDCTSYGRGLVNAADASAARTTIGAVIGTNVQAWDADLDALSAFSSTGLAARTASNTWAQRTLQPPAAGITITNPAGVAGDPTFVLANDLAALEGLSSTGIARRTGTDAWSVGTLVTNAELATMANATFKCRTTAGTGAPEDCTATQSTALLNAMVGDSGSGGTKGLVPAPGAGDAAASKYLSAAGTWSAPSGGGGGSYPDVDRQNSLLVKGYQSKSFAEYRRFINEFVTGIKGASDALNGILTASSSNYTVTTSGAGYVAPSAAITTVNSSYSTDTTVNDATNTIIDRSITIPNSITINTIGIYSTTARTFTCKLAKENSSTSYDIVVSFSCVHGGTGLEFFTVSGGYAVPGSGTYRTGVYHASGNANVKATSALRSYIAGDTAVSTGVAATADTTFGPVTAIQYGSGVNNMTLVTVSQTTDSTVSNGRILIEYDNTATPTLNTDLNAFVSCNGGSNYATATLSAVTSYSGGSSGGLGQRKVAETADTSCGANTGTTPLIKITTANNKNVPVYVATMTVH